MNQHIQGSHKNLMQEGTVTILNAHLRMQNIKPVTFLHNVY